MNVQNCILRPQTRASAFGASFGRSALRPSWPFPGRGAVPESGHSFRYDAFVLVVRSMRGNRPAPRQEARTITSSFVSVGTARVAYPVLGTGPAVLLVNVTGGGDGHWG